MSDRLPSRGREHQPAPHDENAAVELRALAVVAIRNNLCSRLFPDVVAGIQKDIGYEPTAAVRGIAAIIRTAHERGARYTPRKIAGVLCGLAARIERGEPTDGIV